MVFVNNFTTPSLIVVGLTGDERTVLGKAGVLSDWIDVIVGKWGFCSGSLSSRSLCVDSTFALRIGVDRPDKNDLIEEYKTIAEEFFALAQTNLEELNAVIVAEPTGSFVQQTELKVIFPEDKTFFDDRINELENQIAEVELLFAQDPSTGRARTLQILREQLAFLKLQAEQGQLTEKQIADFEREIDLLTSTGIGTLSQEEILRRELEELAGTPLTIADIEDTGIRGLGEQTAISAGEIVAFETEIDPTTGIITDITKVIPTEPIERPFPIIPVTFIGVIALLVILLLIIRSRTK